jgi:hypothetical protein
MVVIQLTMGANRKLRIGNLSKLSVAFFCHSLFRPFLFQKKGCMGPKEVCEIMKCEKWGPSYASS